MTNHHDCWKYICEALGETVPAIFTYGIRAVATPFLKIGRTSNIDKRITSMQTDNPHRLRVVWYWPEDFEADLHRWFAEHLVRGEWFRVSDDEFIAVAALISKERNRYQRAQLESWEDRMNAILLLRDSPAYEVVRK